MNDLALVAGGGAAIRFIIGRFGSGKTFFLNLIRSVALSRRFVVLQADITTERRLHGSQGVARALYAELVRNLSIKSKPDGAALKTLVERWVGDVDHSARNDGGSTEVVKATLNKRLKPLLDLVGGFDFVTVLTRYYEGFLKHDEASQENALRWLRGEYSTKTEARQDLGVRTIIEDDSIYDHLKLLSSFVRIAGYAGLLVNIDEMGVLSHRLANTVARNNNYEAILRTLNDCLQGHVQGLAFLFAGIDEFLEDRRRGLYSYEALASRLAPNRFAIDNRRDTLSPIIRLAGLTPEDCYALLLNIRSVVALGDPSKHLIPDEGLADFLKLCNERMGAECFLSPRETSRDFVGLLTVLHENPALDWKSALRNSPTRSSSQKELSGAQVEHSPVDSDRRQGDDTDLAEFKL